MSPAALPLGRDTLAWVRQGGSPARPGRQFPLMLRWQAYWFERNLELQRQLPLAPPLQADPLFILGLWRSGSTYLHDFLGACPGLIAPATWQCMNPASFRLQSPPAKGKGVQRPMDGVMIDNLSPQEDEFALLALGVPSVYRGFIDPRRLPELGRWLDPAEWAHDRPSGWIDTWKEFLRGVVGGKSGRLVLKSPNHSFHIHALAETFPNAAYVWLVRDPAETFLSNRKMWRAMFERYALWAWDTAVLDRFLGEAFLFAAESLNRATRLLPRERLAIVPFEQLTGTPLSTLEVLNRRLQLGHWSAMQPAFAQIASAKANYSRETYSNPLPDSTLNAIELLRSAQLTAIASHGL